MPKRLITQGQRWPTRSHRGGCLVAGGALMVLYGLSLLPWGDVPKSVLRNVSYAFAIMSPTAWAWLWISCGALAVAGGFFRFDRWAFLCVTALPMAWGIFYTITWLQGHSVPGSRPWLSAGIFICLATILMICAGWEDETTPAQEAVVRARVD